MYSNKNIPTFQDCIASLQLSKITQRTRRGQTVESQNETSCLLNRITFCEKSVCANFDLLCRFWCQLEKRKVDNFKLWKMRLIIVILTFVQVINGLYITNKEYRTRKSTQIAQSLITAGHREAISKVASLACLRAGQLITDGSKSISLQDDVMSKIGSRDIVTKVRFLSSISFKIQNMLMHETYRSI